MPEETKTGPLVLLAQSPPPPPQPAWRLISAQSSRALCIWFVEPKACPGDKSQPTHASQMRKPRRGYLQVAKGVVYTCKWKRCWSTSRLDEAGVGVGVAMLGKVPPRPVNQKHGTETPNRPLHARIFVQTFQLNQAACVVY